VRGCGDQLRDRECLPVCLWVVVGERLGEAGQSSGRDLLERRLVRLVTDASDVDDDPVVGVRHRHHRDEFFLTILSLYHR